MVQQQLQFFSQQPSLRTSQASLRQPIQVELAIKACDQLPPSNPSSNLQQKQQNSFFFDC
jgi:hypothetical protein